MAEVARSTASARLRLLSEAARDLLAADDPDTMLQGLFRRAAEHLPIDAYFNFMVDPDRQALHLASCAGAPEDVVRAVRRLEFGQAVCGTVAASGEPLYPTHIQNSDDPLTDLVRGLGIRAYACNPLRVGTRVLGTLSFGSRTVDRFAQEDLEFFVAICRCVTSAYERLRSEAALRESRQAVLEQNRLLQEQDRRKDDFLAHLGHELRNPLATIANGLHALQLGLSGEQAEDMTSRMTSQLRHLQRLIDDLLDVSRISQGKVTLRPEPCALGALVVRSVTALQPRFEARRQVLEMDVGQPVHVEVDPDRLEQVLSNLLDNAIRWTPDGGCIRVSVEADAPWVTVRVRDAGPGVPPALHERVFEPFAQGADERRGLGLGLAVVRQLVELHGGTVWVDGAGPGGGSEFAFRIPGPCEPPPGGTEPALCPVPPGASVDGEVRRMVLVDDDRDAALSLALLLRRHGFDVQVCHSGAEAAGLVRRARPDCVLLDVGLPDVDGCDVARALRAEPACTQLRLIALTGYGDGRTSRRIAEAGFDGRLLKPLDVAALMRLLAEP